MSASTMIKKYGLETAACRTPRVKKIREARNNELARKRAGEVQ